MASTIPIAAASPAARHCARVVALAEELAEALELAVAHDPEAYEALTPNFPDDGVAYSDDLDFLLEALNRSTILTTAPVPVRRLADRLHVRVERGGAA